MKNAREDKVKTLRILQIDEMIRNGEYPNIPKLMKKFEVSRSTINRDIDFIRDRYNAPLEFDESKKGYYYSNPTFFIKSVMLNEGELFTVSAIIPLLEQYKNTPLEAAFKNILGKIMELLPSQVQIDTSFDKREITFIGDPLPKIDEKVFNTIFIALKSKKSVVFGYKSIERSDYLSRKFDPYKILCQKGNWYALGFCHKHQALRVYALSRMTQIELDDTEFTVIEDFDESKYIDPSFGIWNNEEKQIKIELLFDKDIQTFILERTWHTNQECYQNQDGSVYLSFTSNQLQEILYWVLRFGSSVKVLNPPELKEKVRQECLLMAEKNK